MLNRFLNLLTLTLTAQPVWSSEITKKNMRVINPPTDIANFGSYNTWIPVIYGISRYSVHLSDVGLKEAIKYQDSSSLYYLSQKEDTGLKLREAISPQLHLDLTPDFVEAHLKHGIDPNLALHLGTNLSRTNPTHYWGIEYKTTPDFLSLSSYELFMFDDDPTVTWSKTELASSEQFENLIHISHSLNSGSTKIALGRRWFSVNGQLDIMSGIYLSNSSSFAELRLEKPFGHQSIFLGARVDPNRSDSRLILGMSTTLRKNTNINYSTSPQGTLSKMPSTKPFRRQNLDRLWRHSGFGGVSKEALP